MNKIESNYSKRVTEANKYKVYCKCGHSMVMYPFEHINKKLCSWCGYYIYKDEKEKFKELIIKEKRKVELLCQK